MWHEWPRARDTTGSRLYANARRFGRAETAARGHRRRRRRFVVRSYVHVLPRDPDSRENVDRSPRKPRVRPVGRFFFFSFSFDFFVARNPRSVIPAAVFFVVTRRFFFFLLLFLCRLRLSYFFLSSSSSPNAFRARFSVSFLRTRVRREHR